MAVEPEDAAYQFTLDNDSKKIAKDELHEIESDRAAAVQALRKWVLEQNAWLKAPIEPSELDWLQVDDMTQPSELDWLQVYDFKFLLRFLRVRKYSQVGARETLENYMTNICTVPEWFANVDPAEKKVLELLKMGVYLSPMKVDAVDKRRVIIARFGSIDIGKFKKDFNAQILFRTICLVANWVVRDEHTQIHGLKVLVDWTGVTPQHAKAVFSPDNAKKMMNFYQNSLPKRLKGINMYNEPPFFDLIFSVISSFMKEKTKSRVKLLGRNMASVYEIIDKSVLPDEYLPDDYTGPSAGPLQKCIDDMVNDMLNSDYRDYIMTLTSSKYHVYPKLKPKNQEPVSSFRKLNLD